MILLQGPRKGQTEIKLNIRGDEIIPGETLKYLRIHLDNCGYYGEHINLAAGKAGQIYKAG